MVFLKLIFICELFDPLEQFLTLNLFPGCPPVNNGDSMLIVLGIGLWFITILSIINESNFFSVFRNFYLIAIFKHIDRTLWCFPFYFIDSSIINLTPKNDKKISSNFSVLDIYKLLIKLFILQYNILDKFSTLVFIFFQKLLFFIVGIIKENLTMNKFMFLPIYYFSFLSILFFNVLGLFPYSITATSSFILILNFSFSILIGLHIVGFYLHSTTYFNQFLPEGVPLFVAPILVIIEMFSNVIRIFSLTVRLFANILAGHSLLKIMIGVSWYLISIFIFYLPISILIWLILTPIFILECVIAFLQAYVYVLLLIIYTNDSINIH
jgi:ATP synthase subunit 6